MILTTKEFYKNYIKHYLIIEKSFIDTFSYVQPSKKNYDCFSYKYMDLLITIGSEIDILYLLLTKIINPLAKEKDLYLIIKTFPILKEIQILFKEDESILKPFEGDKEPIWWTEYNELKHNRFEKAVAIDINTDKTYFEFANLHNVIAAISALNILEMFIYRELAMKENESHHDINKKIVIIPNIKTNLIIKNSFWKDTEYGDGIYVSVGDDSYLGKEF